MRNRGGAQRPRAVSLRVACRATVPKSADMSQTPAQEQNSGKAARYAQFAATTAGFLVSTYFVSTVLFDWGPHQDIPAWVRWAVGGFALLFTLSVVVGLAYAASRGYAWLEIEGEELLLFKKQGGPCVKRIHLSEVKAVSLRRDDWDVISNAEGSDLEAVGLQTPSELAGAGPSHAELEIKAQGKVLVVHFQGREAAQEAEKRLKSAVDGHYH